MKNTSFGKLAQFDIGRPVDGDIELKVINNQEVSQCPLGREDRHQVVFCVGGRGVVVMEGTEIDIQSGQSATIPPHTGYYITPYKNGSDSEGDGGDTGCTVMIAYY